jgi:hypothetical protein
MRDGGFGFRVSARRQSAIKAAARSATATADTTGLSEEGHQGRGPLAAGGTWHTKHSPEPEPRAQCQYYAKRKGNCNYNWLGLQLTGPGLLCLGALRDLGTKHAAQGATEKKRKKNVRTYFIRPGIGLDARAIS